MNTIYAFYALLIFLVACIVAFFGGVALVSIAEGIGLRLRVGRNQPDCKLTQEQKKHNQEVEADEGREDYIGPEHDWANWETTTAKTDGYSTCVVQERHCLNCGYREFSKTKIKY